MVRPRLRVSFLALALCVGGAACREDRPSPPAVDGHSSAHRKHHARGDDPEEAERSARRVYAKGRFVWIRKSPDVDAEWLGYITLGESVAVRDGVVTAKSDTHCPAWVAVAPEGWICAGREATLDANDETVVRLAEHGPNRASAWPFDYARSLGAPRYRGIPTERDERAHEGDVDLLRKRIDRARLVKTDDEVRAIDPRLAGVELGMTSAEPPTPFQPTPDILETDDDVAYGSTVAYSYEFDHHGRAWLLTWDHAVVPEVHVKKYPRSAFRGVTIGDGDGALPLGFTKKTPAPKFERANDGSFRAKEATFPMQSAVALTDDAPVASADGTRYRTTKEPGVFVAEKDVVIVSPIGEPPSKLDRSGRATWVEVSTVGGWLVAFEDKRPVYATLISAGRARMLDDKNMAPISATPNGTFTILSKLATTTMRSESRPDSVHAEVMFTQVFHEGFALHGAYWHDDFGDRKSAGCVNLSPIDAKWLFDWSEPAVPPDWHAKRVMPGDPATWVVVHP